MNKKQIENNIEDMESLQNSLIDTPYGSFIMSVLIMRNIHLTAGEFVKYMKKCEFPYIDEDDFYNRTWNEFKRHSHINDDYNGLPLAIAKSPYNTLIVPFIPNKYGQSFEAEDGSIVTPEYVLCPLNKEGRYNYTLAYAIVHDTWQPIDYWKPLKL